MSNDVDILKNEDELLQGSEETHRFKFSVITAVYNVEQYIEECIKSIVEQNIDFEKNVQMILIDDGSTDASGAICDRYAEKYPDNIIVVHKENGGVSSARNIGIELAVGEYVNFLDSDDMLSRNTLSGVYAFFRHCKAKTDIVSIPMWFFEGATGKHILNYKFAKGKRVIRLDDDWTAIQNSLASAFVKLECIKKFRFDTRLTNLEDAQLVQKILAEKCTLGVFPNAKYLYRRRTGGSVSAVQGATSRATWYVNCLRYFHYETIEYYLQRHGYVPKFIQNIIAYDIQWRIQQTSFPEGVLTEEEQEEYLSLLYGLLKYIDDDVICAQKNIWKEHKMFLLRKKYGDYPMQSKRDNDVILHYRSDVVSKLSQCTLKIDFLRITDDSVRIIGSANFLGFPPDAPISVYAAIAGKRYVAEPIVRAELTQCVYGEHLYAPYAFEIRLPLEDQQAISFGVMMDDVIPEEYITPQFGVHFPVSAKIKCAYCELNGYIITCAANRIIIRRSTPKILKEKEREYRKYLWKSGAKPQRKAAIARTLNGILKRMQKKPIWLLADRMERASDNAEAMALYLNENVKDIDVYFCLKKDSPDYERLRRAGLKILEPYSKEYKIKYLQADVLLSSQVDDVFFRPMYVYYNDIVAQKKMVFLQHGITQNDLSRVYGKYATNMSLFVTAAIPEQRSILEGNYHYDENEVALTGFARYDRLYSTNEKTILFAPTWRLTVVGRANPQTGLRDATEGAENSSYCRTYSALLSDPRLIEAAKQYGYKLKYVVHPNMVNVTRLMQFAPEVETFSPDVEYRDIFACGSLLVTDYSSVAFDFAYLRKPVMYFQFDTEEFFGGKHTLQKGYFDCERDGFGEVTDDLDATVALLIDYMKNDCKLKDVYRERIDGFFAFNDQNNCKRIYEKILEMK